MSSGDSVRFRQPPAIWVAGAVAFFGALPFATARWYLLPVLLIPLGIVGWALRSGTEVDAAGIRVRALLGQRRIDWSQIAGLAAAPRGRAVAHLHNGQTVALPAVRAGDLPRLVAASGQSLDGATIGGAANSEGEH